MDERRGPADKVVRIDLHLPRRSLRPALSPWRDPLQHGERGSSRCDSSNSAGEYTSESRLGRVPPSPLTLDSVVTDLGEQTARDFAHTTSRHPAVPRSGVETDPGRYN